MVGFMAGVQISENTTAVTVQAISLYLTYCLSINHCRGYITTANAPPYVSKHPKTYVDVCFSRQINATNVAFSVI